MNAMNYYLLLNNQQAGPFTMTQLMSMWTSGQITCETPHFFDGLGEWVPVGTFIEEAIAEESQKSKRKAARFESQTKSASAATGARGWSGGEYLLLVVLTLLVPFIGFAVGIIGVWNPDKRQQAGQLMGLSLVIFLAGMFFLTHR